MTEIIDVMAREILDSRGNPTLEVAIATSTIVPAKALGQHIPQFNPQGRLQVGMDADITVFDAKTVKANATWDDVAALNDGFHYTLVNGVQGAKSRADSEPIDRCPSLRESIAHSSVS